MHHRHAVLHRDALPASCLNVDVTARKTGQNQRVPSVNQVSTVELRVDADRQFQSPHSCADVLGVGCRRDEIATKSNEDLRVTIDHGLQRLNDGMPMMLRRMKPEDLLN